MACAKGTVCLSVHMWPTQPYFKKSEPNNIKLSTDPSMLLVIQAHGGFLTLTARVQFSVLFAMTLTGPSVVDVLLDSVG